MQTLNSKEERTIAGGATIDDWAQGLQNAGYNVDVYSDPNDVPEDLWNSGSTSSSSTSYSSSGSYQGSMGTYYLNEVIVEAANPNFPGYLIGLKEYSSLSEYVYKSCNTELYVSIARRSASLIPGKAGIVVLQWAANESYNSERIQSAHATAISSLLDGGHSNNHTIAVSTRQDIFGQTEVRVYDVNTGTLILTTGFRP